MWVLEGVNRPAAEGEGAPDRGYRVDGIPHAVGVAANLLLALCLLRDLGRQGCGLRGAR